MVSNAGAGGGEEEELFEKPLQVSLGIQDTHRP